MLRPQFGDLMCCTVQGLVDLAALRLAANNMGLTANMTRKHPNIPETSPEKTWPSRPRGPRVLLKDEFEGALVSQFRCPGCPLFAFCCLPYHRPSKSKDGARSQFYEEASRHRPCAPHPVIKQQKPTCYFEQEFVDLSVAFKHRPPLCLNETATLWLQCTLPPATAQLHQGDLKILDLLKMRQVSPKSPG